MNPMKLVEVGQKAVLAFERGEAAEVEKFIDDFTTAGQAEAGPGAGPEVAA